VSADVTRVVFLLTQLGGGGAESHVLRLANRLDRERFSVEVATVRKGGSYEAKLERHVRLTHLTDYPVQGSSFGSLLPAVPKLHALLGKTRPHVLCAVLEHASLAAMAARLGVSDRPALVLCVQNNPQRMYPSRLAPIDVGMRLAFTHLYHRADAVVALSRGVGDALASIDPRLRDRLHVIPNAALDQDVLAGAETPASRQGVQPGERLLVACGRLTEQKGYPDLLRAIALLRHEQPVRLWILGEGPDRAELERCRSDLGLDGVVEFLGFRPNPYAYMAAADLFVLSSRWEGFGNVIVEAMASGAPVVSTDCPHGPGEIIQHGRSGLLVPVGDSTALAAAILRVLADDGLRRRLSQGGRERANAFDARLVAQAYGDVFIAVRPSVRLAGGAATRVVMNPEPIAHEKNTAP
jgi:glycosyltransferase involved in cell wall biosynthesis